MLSGDVLVRVEQGAAAARAKDGDLALEGEGRAQDDSEVGGVGAGVAEDVANGTRGGDRGRRTVAAGAAVAAAVTVVVAVAAAGVGFGCVQPLGLLGVSVCVGVLYRPFVFGRTCTAFY
jgi:hypothetical protein